MSLQDIISMLRAKKAELQSKYPISSMGVFGSYARNEQIAESDIDILVEFNGSIGLRFVDLADELEAYLGKKVDLVSKKGVKHAYFEFIKNEIKYV